MRMKIETSSINDYRKFLRIKSLPSYRFIGRTAVFPDEYASLVDETETHIDTAAYQPVDGLFDYQAEITRLAIQKRKFSIFADCGLGKTLMLLEFARHSSEQIGDDECCLIISPLMVVPQTLAEAKRFYKGLDIVHLSAAELPSFLEDRSGAKIGITNYDALKDDTPQGRLGSLILDESSMLKSHYGKWGQTCLRLGRGLDWKLAATGTPAPNDRIEYANHAVFMDAFPTVNSFLARYFVNRGQTDNRWELKQHAMRSFYRALSHWCIFLTNPSTYGWKDNCESIPPIQIHQHAVPLTPEQQSLAYDETGTLYADRIGGITSRSVLSQIAKGVYQGKDIETNKPNAIRALVKSWPDESTIIWCKFNSEQERISRELPDAGNIDGTTPIDRRMAIIDDFKAGRIKVLISKPRILGFGLNLQIATRQIFSGLQDSYEEFYQAVKRSNRYGSTRPLNVHIPVTDIERPMIETVLVKAGRVQRDTEEQEKIFKESGYDIARRS
jgi:superfamily II DNA or RNA helicase